MRSTFSWTASTKLAPSAGRGSDPGGISGATFFLSDASLSEALPLEFVGRDAAPGVGSRFPWALAGAISAYALRFAQAAAEEAVSATRWPLASSEAAQFSNLAMSSCVADTGAWPLGLRVL